MPTAEWLSKYGSIKDKLACKTEPPAGGTATIPSTSATTRRTRSALCMCGSSTLKPVTRSRNKEESSDGMAETGADGGPDCEGYCDWRTVWEP